jgi:hypothetical protein
MTGRQQESADRRWLALEVRAARQYVQYGQKALVEGQCGEAQQALRQARASIERANRQAAKLPYGGVDKIMRVETAADKLWDRIEVVCGRGFQGSLSGRKRRR